MIVQWRLLLLLLPCLSFVAESLRAATHPPIPGVDNKFLSRYVPERETLLLRRKIFLYKDDLYTPWSDWNNCSLKDCTEFRFRRCVNESFEERYQNMLKSSVCPFQYVAETRRCRDDSQCRKPGPAPLLVNLTKTCGIRPAAPSISTKIMGGKKAVPHSWPWQVALYVSPLMGRRGPASPASRADSPFCGATLIAPGWLMTAAHCLSELVPYIELPVGEEFSMEEEAEQVLTARIGDHVRGQVDGPHETSVTVEQAIIHPEYRRGYSERGYDVALLKLEKPVELGSKIGTICVPDKTLNLPRGHNCYAAGWGEMTGETIPQSSSFLRPPTAGGGLFGNVYGGRLMDLFYGGYFGQPTLGLGHFHDTKQRQPRAPRKVQPLSLMEVELPLVSLSECRWVFQNLQEGIHVCAGKKGRDTCRGDSGGGLFCQNPTDGRWYIYGVTSFGSGRGCGKNYGVYTCTRGISDWIHDVLK